MGGIFICEYCKMYKCPPPCPNYNGKMSGLDKRLGICEICEDSVRVDDGHFDYEGRFLCADCARELLSDELLDFLECKDASEFFELLK